MSQRFMILDGSSLLFRAFYALPLLTSPTGEYTNAVVGFSNMLQKMIAEYKPDCMVVAFDKSRHTFRTEMFADYKGNRDKAPEEFSAQVPLLREFLEGWGIPFLEMDNYEADDIIGTLSKRAEEAGGYEVLIVTGDRDALQLVSKDVNVLYTRKGISDIVRYDEAAFKEKYGFEPIRLIDLKGLMGDSSDNIPGVPGVGEKTATKLLLQFGFLEDVYAHIDEVSGKKLKEKLTENQAQAELSKKLATIERNAPVEFTPEEYAITPDHERFFAFCDKYGMRSARQGFEKLYPAQGTLLLELGTEETEQKPKAARIADRNEAEVFADKLRKASAPAFCGVYEGKVPHLKLRALGLSTGDENAVVESGSEAWDILYPLLEDASLRWVTIDLKSFFHVGGSREAHVEDVQLAAYLADPSIGTADVEQLRSIWLPSASAISADEDETEKAAEGAGIVSKLWPVIFEKLKGYDMEKLYNDMEKPLVAVLAEMEENGIYVNRDRLSAQAEAVGKKLLDLEQEIYTLAKHSFNINSPKQLGEVLFDELGLPAQKKTKTGYSTNAEVLNSLRYVHPIVEKILEYRLWMKLKSTYLDSIGELIDSETKRVHTTFNQMVTATGRLSSSDPNLQNIPVRKEEGRIIREFFEPGEGYDYLLSADYSQIELRILAHLSQDKNFVNAFTHDEDIHARTASEVFGVPMEDVTSELRSRAKAVNFGIVYGISDYGLSQDLGISRKDAAGYIKSYFEKCPGVKSFIDGTVSDAHEKGYVTTLFGRRRDLPQIHSKNFTQRSLAERMAMNTPIQGTAADIIKLAMVAAYRAIKDAGLKSRILLQVHDELVIETTEEELSKVQEILRGAMEKIVSLSVPLPIDIHYGKNWAEAK